MVSGEDLRQVMQAGLWEALAVDGSDRAALRATCRDARDMADALHETAVLPVGPGTWDSAAAMAAYHRRLGDVRSVHVVYSGAFMWCTTRPQDEARAAHFMEAYSAALGAPLPAASCSIVMTRGRQLPTALGSVLLQRVVPHVERLDMALGWYDNVEQLLRALEPCARLCSLRLHPAHAAERVLYYQDFEDCPGALDALCRLPRLHTLTGPWNIHARHLQRMCDALPSLTTLGFRWLVLEGASGACISPRLHTLAPWCHSAGDESLRLDRPWHLQLSTCSIYGVRNLQAALPAVRHLDALVLDTYADLSLEDLPALQATAQRFAACAERWAWAVSFRDSQYLQVLQGVPRCSWAALKHLTMVLPVELVDAPADVASTLGSLVSAAPNITTLMMDCDFGSPTTEALAAMMQPLRRAAHLHTLWLSGAGDDETLAVAGQAALLEGVVRCLVQPGAEGGEEYCRALQHVLLAGAQPEALAACTAALARDGIHVPVGSCDIVVHE